MTSQRLLVALLATLALPAHADLARSFSSAVYSGVGVSKVKPDFDNLGEAINLDVIGGYRITPELAWGQVSAELNFAVTVSPGKNKGQPQSSTLGGGLLGGGSTTTQQGRFTQSSSDLAMQNLTLQGVYHTPGRFYGIGHAGYTLVNTNIQEIQDDGRSAFSYGGGIGFRFGQETAAIEAVYTHTSRDLQTIGLRISY